jgi:ATP-binding cassette subfamily B protein
MPAIQPMRSELLSLLIRLWNSFPAKRKKQFAGLLCLMAVSSIAEVLSIGAVVPFLAVLTEPEVVFRNSLGKTLAEQFAYTEAKQIQVFITLTFVALISIAGCIRLLLVYSSIRFSFRTGSDLSLDIYRRTLYQPYEVHLGRNSSDVISGILTKTNSAVYEVILPVVMLGGAVALIVAIVGSLVVIDPLVAGVTFGGFGLIYLTVGLVTRKSLARNGELVARESSRVVKSLQEGLGGIRDVLLDGSQKTFAEAYQRADIEWRRAQGKNQLIGATPRYGVETLGMLIIAALGFAMSQKPGGMSLAIPTLGAIALGAQRMLPALQQCYATLSSLRGAAASLREVVTLLEQPIPANVSDDRTAAKLPFDEAIDLKSVTFGYAGHERTVLKEINLKICRGDRIGIIGTTGSGKSTLIDMIMDLLSPTDGEIEIDGHPLSAENLRSWQSQIAHVPQSIYLFDGTIEENIAFGVPMNLIDRNRVQEAAQRARIHEVIEELPEGYQTVVGERGVRLSGGQRQRIGIARALYKKAKVMVLDEATSALDNATEAAVMDSMAEIGRELTILIIAHRLTTLSRCDRIIEMDAGTISRIGPYESMVNQSVR